MKIALIMTSIFIKTLKFVTLHFFIHLVTTSTVRKTLDEATHQPSSLSAARLLTALTQAVDSRKLDSLKKISQI